MEYFGGPGDNDLISCQTPFKIKYIPKIFLL